MGSDGFPRFVLLCGILAKILNAVIGPIAKSPPFQAGLWLV
jgi:hypothetical protein